MARSADYYAARPGDKHLRLLVSDEFFLDPRAVRRSFDRASRTYDAAAHVHAEIRNRLLERLDLVRIAPLSVLDLGAGTGHASRALKRRYPAAQVVALDLSPAMLRESERQQRFLRRFARVAGDAHCLPLKDASVDLVLSNLVLQWCHDLNAVFAQVARVLRPNGLFTFTTLGPDTLRELRHAWRTIDLHTHVHRFIDMHDIGDALVRASFAEPVMDTERLTVTYPDFAALTQELRASGSRNVAQGRPRGLTGQLRAQAMRSHGEALRRNGTLNISVEIVYGHAWAVAQPRPKRGSDEVRVPIEALRKRRSH